MERCMDRQPIRYRLIIALISWICLCLGGCSYAAGPVNVRVGVNEEAKQPGQPSQPEEADEPVSGEELIDDSDLSSVSSYWGLYQESGGSATFGPVAGKLAVKISDPGRRGHSVQLYRDGFELLEGGSYHFSARISSDTERTIELRIQVNGGDYHPYMDMEDVKIGPDLRTISCDFTMTEPSDPAPRMCFNLGDEGGEQKLSAHSIYIDSVSLLLSDDSNAKAVDNKGEMMDVNIDQAGYRPGDEKRAVVRIKDKEAGSFEVTDCDTGKTVYNGELVKGPSGGSSGDTVMYADFSQVTRPGRYRIDTDCSGSSYEFDIGEDIYDMPLKDAQRMLYLQRCGTALPEGYAGDFAHKACHMEKAAIYGGEGSLDVSGGWHDAGDYGRYTVPAAKAVADLMLAYELYPECFGDDNDIPESGNGIPDILDEARYELEWMLKMQRDDGMVYHKVTGLNFDGVCKADECTEKLYVISPSKTATADLAGAMYMAARIYADIDRGFADRCLVAAGKALDAYMDHIGERNFVNPPDVLTGEYKDGNSADELFWAVCEGYRTTGDKTLGKKLDGIDLTRIEGVAFDWANVSGYGLYAYLCSQKELDLPFDPEEMYLKFCDELVGICHKEAYGSTIMDDYFWGSNMTIANNGMGLLLGHKLTQKTEYLLAARRQLHYLFGTNANSYCFLTGYGSQCPEDPHHRPSQAIHKCMKGMLVGGPDSKLDDVYAKAVLAGRPKARCYVDNSQSYSCNEITIYWNSPLCFLLAGCRMNF